MTNNDRRFKCLSSGPFCFFFCLFPLEQLGMYPFLPHKSGKTIPLPLGERTAPAVMPFPFMQMAAEESSDCDFMFAASCIYIEFSHKSICV